MASSATQKEGAKALVYDTVRMSQSSHESRNRAASTPITNEPTSTRARAQSTSSAEATNRLAMTVETFSPGTSRETPRSPVATLPSQRPNCAGMGWSRPQSFS